MPMRRTTLAFVAVGVLGLPAVAQAKTKNVDMGLPPSAGKAFQAINSDVNDFFPHGVTIHAGDKVRFLPVGFHNVHVPVKSGQLTPVIAPTGTKANARDEAGAPFWFNGQAVLGLNAALATNNAFGRSVRYHKGFQSGLPLGNKPKPVLMKFPKAGLYTYYCDVHPGMKGTVKVVRASRSIPSAKADRKALKKQLATALARAKLLAKAKSPVNTLSLGVSGKGGVERLAFVPDTLTVARGTTVAFVMPKNSLEIHTATVGPGDPLADTKGTTYLGKLAASFNAPTFDPIAAYPSDLPGTAVSLTTTTHGNGFWNAGVLDADAKSPPANANAVKFDQAGTFKFYCLIHTFMSATVTVQ